MGSSFSFSICVLLNRLCLSRKSSEAGVSKDMLLNYQVGNLKRCANKIIAVSDYVDRDVFIDASVYLSKYRKYKNLGKIATGLSKVRTKYCFFLKYDELGVDLELIQRYISGLKEYDAVLSDDPVDKFKFCAFTKKSYNIMLGLLEEGFLSEEEVLDRLDIKWIPRTAS